MPIHGIKGSHLINQIPERIDRSDPSLNGPPRTREALPSSQTLQYSVASTIQHQMSFLLRPKHLAEQQRFKNFILSWFSIVGNLAFSFLLPPRTIKAMAADQAREEIDNEDDLRRLRRQCRKTRMPTASGTAIRGQRIEAMNPPKVKLKLNSQPQLPCHTFYSSSHQS